MAQDVYDEAMAEAPSQEAEDVYFTAVEVATNVYGPVEAEAQVVYEQAREEADDAFQNALNAAGSGAVYEKAETEARVIYNKAEKNKGG